MDIGDTRLQSGYFTGVADPLNGVIDPNEMAHVGLIRKRYF